MLSTILYNRIDTFASKLDWNPTPASGIELDGVSLLAMCSDGNTLAVLVQSPSAFLHRVSARNLDGMLTGLLQWGEWAYLLLVGTLEADSKGCTRINGKPSKWHWHSVQGALASVQERGVTVLYAPDAAAVPALVAMLAARDRSTKRLHPPRDALFLSPAETLLTSLPSISIATAERLLHSTGGNLAWGLSALTDPSVDVGISDEQRGKIRDVFGLTGDEIIAVHLKGENDA